MKKIGILLLIIIVLIGALAFKVLESKKEQKNNQEIIPLLQKGLSYDNYVLKYKIGYEHRTKIVKGNIITEKTEETDNYRWTNLDLKENIMMDLEKKNALIIQIKEEQIKEIKERTVLPKEEIIREIINNSEKYDLKNIKQEEYNEKQCMVFIIKTNEKEDGFILTKEEEVSTPGIYLEKIWIDKNTGTIVKSQSKNNKGILIDIEYEIELNTVKDSDVARPNLEGYKIQNISQ